MAAMIGVKADYHRQHGLLPMVMYNPVLISKAKPYQTEEGCLSLEGIRPTTRYQEIEVEFLMLLEKSSLKLTDFQAHCSA